MFLKIQGQSEFFATIVSEFDFKRDLEVVAEYCVGLPAKAITPVAQPIGVEVIEFDKDFLLGAFMGTPAWESPLGRALRGK